MISSLFVTFFNMSLTASFVIAAVMFIRLLIKRVPKIFSYALWSVVLLRLILPFSFESVISLVPYQANVIPHTIVSTQSTAMTTGIDQAGFSHTNISSTNVMDEAGVRPDFAAGTNTTAAMIKAAAIVWLTGIALLLCFSFVSYFRLKSRLTIATLVRDNIYETDHIQSPFVLGFMKPRIYIPTGLSEAELNYILMHEQVHIKRKDYIIKPVYFFAVFLHWFNPLVWISYFLMVKDMEMSCDENVIKNTGTAIRADYSAALLNLAAKPRGLICPLSFGESNIKARIRNVLSYKKPKFWVTIVVLVIIILFAAALLANPGFDDKEETAEIILQGNTLRSLGLSIDLNQIRPFDDPNYPEDHKYVEAYSVFQVEEADLSRLSLDDDYGNITVLTINHSYTQIDMNQIPALYIQGFRKDTEHDDNLFIDIGDKLYNISGIDQYKMYEDDEVVVFDISELLAYDFEAKIDHFAQSVDHYNFDWLNENYRYLKTYEDIHIKKGMLDKIIYQITEGNIADFISYIPRNRSMYIVGLKVFDEFGTKNEGTVQLNNDENILTFGITKSTGTMTGAVDGPHVSFVMDLAANIITEKAFDPAPDYGEQGRGEEFTDHRGEVIELTDERMVEIGKYFEKLMVDIEANKL